MGSVATGARPKTRIRVIEGLWHLLRSPRRSPRPWPLPGQPDGVSPYDVSGKCQQGQQQLGDRSPHSATRKFCTQDLSSSPASARSYSNTTPFSGGGQTGRKDTLRRGANWGGILSKKQSFVLFFQERWKQFLGLLDGVKCLSRVNIFPGGSVVKNPPAMQEMQVQSLGQEDPLEKEMATHASVLAWKILWTEEPGVLQFMVSQRVRHET